MEDAMAVRPAVSMAGTFFAIHRAPEVARLSVNDGEVDNEACEGDPEANRQKNDRYRLGQLPRLL